MTAIPSPISSAIALNAPPAASAASAASTARWLAGAQILAAALLGGAVAINDGRFHWQAMQWLAGAVFVLAGGLILCRAPVTTRVTRRMLHIGMLLVIGAQVTQLALGGGITGSVPDMPHWTLLACLLTIDLGLLTALVTRLKVLGGGLMIGGFAAAAFAIIWTSPNVRIDVLEFQRESSIALLAGHNPYHARYRNVYHPSTEFYGAGAATADGWLTYSFPYPPVSLLLVVPGQLAGDTRFSSAAAVCAAAILLMLAGRNHTAILAAGVLLTSPRLLHVVQLGWTEPLLILLAAAVLFTAVRARWLLWATLGAWIASKQYLVLAVPLLPLLQETSESASRFTKAILFAGLFAAAVTVPFAAADWSAFARSTIEWQLVQPFRYDALSFPALSAQLGGATSGGLPGFIAAGIAGLIALWKAPRTAGGFFTATAVVFCCFFACNKQAFCNYYQLVIGLSCCAIVGLSVTREAPLPAATATINAKS